MAGRGPARLLGALCAHRSRVPDAAAAGPWWWGGAARAALGIPAEVRVYRNGIVRKHDLPSPKPLSW